MSGTFFTAYRYRRGAWVSKPSGTNVFVIGKTSFEAIRRARNLFPKTVG